MSYEIKKAIIEHVMGDNSKKYFVEFSSKRGIFKSTENDPYTFTNIDDAKLYANIVDKPCAVLYDKFGKSFAKVFTKYDNELEAVYKKLNSITNEDGIPYIFAFTNGGVMSMVILSIDIHWSKISSYDDIIDKSYRYSLYDLKDIEHAIIEIIENATKKINEILKKRGDAEYKSKMASTIISTNRIELGANNALTAEETEKIINDTLSDSDISKLTKEKIEDEILRVKRYLASLEKLLKNI